MRKAIFSVVWTLALLAAGACGKDNEGGGGGSGTAGFSVDVSLPQHVGKDSWSTADRLMVYSLGSTATLPSAALSAQGSGAETRFTTTSSVASGSEYWLLYPQSAAIVASSTAIYAVVPSSQTAVEGAADASSVLAVGSTTNRSGKVSLQAALAPMQFTLTGEGAASVKKLTVNAGAFVAGDVKISGIGGTPSVVSDNTRNRAGQQNSVTLSGEFRAGGTYIVSLVPAGSTTLELVFEDAGGRKQRVEKTVSLQSGKTQNLGSIQLEAYSGDTDFVAEQTATKTGIKPYVLVVMGDGFTEAEREKFMTAASATASFIFGVEPFKHFKDYFSVYLGWAAATTSGVGKTWGTQTNSGTMASYGQNGRNRIYQWIGERCPEVKAGATPLDNVGVIMLVNNNSYIRPVCDWENSGRFVAPVGLYGNSSSTASRWCYGATWADYEWRDGVKYTLTDAELTVLGYTKSGSYWAVNGDYRHEALHEAMGHGFTRLMDEYWYGDRVFPDCTYSNIESYYHQLSAFPTGLNISASSSTTPWDLLLAEKESLTASDTRYGRIGVYEGGLAEVLQGVWRPEQVSVMMDNRPYFSTWQRALAWQRLMHVSGEQTDCDVWHNAADLKAYLEIDKAISGSKDPLRDQ